MYDVSAHEVHASKEPFFSQRELPGLAWQASLYDADSRTITL